MDNKTGKRIGLYISEELLDQCDAAVGKSDADSRSEFICEAIMHYTHATNKAQEQAAAKMGDLLKQAL